MATIIHQKKLCMSELHIQYSSMDRPHFYDLSAGKITSSFVYIVKGAVTVTAVNRTLSLKSGDLFYIPDNIPYSAKWQGAPDIAYISVHAVSKSYDTAIARSFYPLQHFPSLSTPQTGASFKEMYELMATEERINKIKAISLYYAFYAQVLPLMTESEPIKYSDALLKALEYIDEHFSEDTPVAVIATACFVSESRLFNLFREQLGTTPVAYRNEKRIQKAAELLKGDSSIESVSEAVGFNSPTYFREIFKSLTSLTPSQYRASIRG